MRRTLRLEVERETSKIQLMAYKINELDIDEEHKSLFFNLIMHRGIVGYELFLDTMQYVYDNRCEVTRLLLEGKECGIETIGLFASCPDKKRRVDVYRDMSVNGVKGVDVARELMVSHRLNLLDLIEEED